MKYLESTKFITAVAVLNIIILAVLVFSLIFMKQRDDQAELMPASMAESGKPGTDYTEADDNLASMCMKLLENSYADLGNGTAYYFEEAGIFHGFFDVEHPDVKEYHYAVDIAGEDIVLTIYDQKETQTVSYELIFADNGGLALGYPGVDEAIPLQY